MRLLIPVSLAAAVGTAAASEGQAERGQIRYEEIAHRIEDCLHFSSATEISLDEIIAALRLNDLNFSPETNLNENSVSWLSARTLSAVKKCLSERVECRGGP